MRFDRHCKFLALVLYSIKPASPTPGHLTLGHLLATLLCKQKVGVKDEDSCFKDATHVLCNIKSAPPFPERMTL